MPPIDDGMTPQQKRRVEDLLEGELAKIRGERAKWFGVTFDRKVSVGNLLSIVLMLWAVFQAYFTLNHRLTMVEYQMTEVVRGQDKIERFLGIWDARPGPPR